VPAEEGVGLHDGNSPAPRGKQRGAQEEFQPVGYAEHGTLLASTKDVDLVERSVLDDQVASGTAHVDSHAHNFAAGGAWAQAMPDPLGGVHSLRQLAPYARRTIAFLRRQEENNRSRMSPALQLYATHKMAL
jgi:hypothetical protein